MSSHARWAAMVLGAAIALLAPGGAAAASSTAVTMFSDGDYVGAGQQRTYEPANAEIVAGGGETGVSVSVSGGSGETASFSLEFTAPPGQALGIGTYDGAERSSFREAGHPGIDISGDGRGCNEQAGRFEVLDYVRGIGERVERLWIVYEQHCEGGSAALFGEVRINVPVPDGPWLPASGLVRWPEHGPGQAHTVVPITVRAGAPVRMAGASVAGRDAGDFTVRLDECRDRELPAGGACQVFVRFAEKGPGTREGVLRLADTGGGVREIGLQGWAPGGTTRLQMTSDEGDYIGGGQSWSYSPANAHLGGFGSREGVGFGVVGTDGTDWSGEFSPGQGDIIAPGRYTGATRNAFRGPEPGIDVSGNGRGCNEIEGEFTIREATFEDDGSVRTLGLDFVQHCEGGEPALRGTFEYRFGDTTPRAPWMATSPTRPATGEGDDGGSGSGSGEPADPFGRGFAGTSPPDFRRVGVRPLPAHARAGACSRARYERLAMVLGTRRGDSLTTRRVAERIFAGPGRDSIEALSGDDCVDGGSGADIIDAGAGRDTVIGGAGNDRLIGGPGRDLIDCGRGRDVALAGPGDRTRGCERRLRARR